MKRKIGEIYNKPIIEGDINLKTSNEIHKSELSSSGGSASSDGEYYKFITHDSLNDMKQMACLLKYKNMIANEYIIESSDIYTNYNNYKAFCFMPINICTSEGCRYIKSLVTFLKEAYGIEDMSAIGIQPITKEEFYKIDY